MRVAPRDGKQAAGGGERATLCVNDPETIIAESPPEKVPAAWLKFWLPMVNV